MKPSHTSPSDSPFAGVLLPLVDLVARQPRRSGHLAGQDVVLPRDDVRAIVALDSEDDIHLLLSPASSDDARFTRLELRGLRISDRDWSVGGRPAERYLDISCETGTTPSFRRPFLRFAEDVLQELVASETSTGDAVYRTGARWRRFWSADTSTHISPEWLHGLLGELAFLAAAAGGLGTSIVRSWTGPLGHDHDFQLGNDIAVEVKASSQIPFTIHCNLNQLDPGLFRTLYLVCYRLTPSDTGVSLSDLVKQIEAMMKEDEGDLDLFYRALAAAGYRRDQEPAYSEHRFQLSAAAAFPVTASFPRLTESSFVAPPDHRISGIRYTLQLTGLGEVPLGSILSDLARLSQA